MSASLLLALAASAAASPLSLVSALTPRDSIDHDAVVAFSQTVPSGTTGDQYLAYQPYLYVEDGCVPFPGVDADGTIHPSPVISHFVKPY